jgi:MoaA/NifB/PqqE/SkfB family radical SAM enzyme
MKLSKALANPKSIKDILYYKMQSGRVAKVSYPPPSLTIAILGTCFFKCVFCVNHCPDAKKDENANKLYKIPFKLSLNQFKFVVDWAYDGRIPHFHICGAGEPFLHKNIIEMIDYVIFKYGKVSMQTDFSEKLFDDGKYLESIIERKENISYITTDILSWDKKVHEEMKCGSNFHRLFEYIEYISCRSNIIIDVHHILTKNNYKDLYKLPEMLYQRNINFKISVVNLHPYGFNSWTDISNVYLNNNRVIKKELDKFSKFCQSKKISFTIPLPFDSKKSKCKVFWSRIQLIPIKTLQKEKWIGNAIPGYCNAVVNGKLDSIGNIFDYNDVMEFWNNPILVKIRQDLINGKYPEKACASCQNYV